MKLTTLVGLAVYFLLPGFPENAHKSWSFITQEEAQWIIDRINHDRGDAIPEPFKLRTFLRASLDIKIWGYALIFM